MVIGQLTFVESTGPPSYMDRSVCDRKGFNPGGFTVQRFGLRFRNVTLEVQPRGQGRTSGRTHCGVRKISPGHKWRPFTSWDTPKKKKEKVRFLHKTEDLRRDTSPFPLSLPFFLKVE